MTDESDLAAKLQAVIWHGQDLSGDGRAWLADLIASGDQSLVPRARRALDAFVVLRNFYGRDLMAELLIGLLGGRGSVPGRHGCMIGRHRRRPRPAHRHGVRPDR